MKAFIVLALAAVANSQFLASPYAAGLPLAGAPYAGLWGGAYAGVPWTGAALGYGYAPAIAPIPAAAPSTQYRAQDEFGNLNFGYANINSARQEAGNAYAGVTGSYQYVDPTGKLQTTSYIADALGFRVQATNLPVAPVANLVQPENTLVGPEPVMDTPEVAAAKAEFQAAFAAEASREKRQAEEKMEEAKPVASILPYGIPYAGLGYGLGLPATYGLGLGYGLGNYGYGLGNYGYGLGAYGYGLGAYGYGIPAASAIVPSAPAVRDATLTKIKLTPGHAIAYKVE